MKTQMNLKGCLGWKAKTEEGKGVDPAALDLNAPVKVGARHSSGRTDFSDHIPLLDKITPLDSKAGEMAVERENSQTMIDDHCFSRKIEV